MCKDRVDIGENGKTMGEAGFGCGKNRKFIVKYGKFENSLTTQVEVK